MFYKRYEYLEDSYHETANETLSRQAFLSKIDSFVSQKKYVRITLLNWEEEPLKEIQGEITTGSIALDGSSAVRRTLSLSTAVNATDYTIENANSDFAINKKIYVEVGIVNKTDQYPEYPILWFPQGLYFIKSFSCATSSSSGVSITLSCVDKMAMLNGDVGGTFPAATVLDEEDTQTAEGKIVSEKIPVYRIIQEMINHFGSEDLNNIVIEDVPLRIKRIMQWNGTNPLYLRRMTDESGKEYYQPSIDKQISENGWTAYSQGEDVGYVWEDYTWSGELTANAGESVQTILEKIKSALGNYEYFYDVFGVFHFREIRNYLNTTQASTLLKDMSEYNYFLDSALPKHDYTFSSDANLISLNCSPQYDKIKNDFVVQGLRKMTSSNISIPIRYHLAIDTKPDYTIENGEKIYGIWSKNDMGVGILIYVEADTGTRKMCLPIPVWSKGSNINTVYDYGYGDFNEVYIQKDTSASNSSKIAAYIWTGEGAWKQVEVVNYYYEDANGNDKPYKTKDWRTELYVRGVYARHNHSIDEGYYFAELESSWPLIYDLDEQKFWGEEEDEANVARVLCDGNYYLDFIDAASSQMGEFGVSSIGRRTDVVVDEDINCLFEPEIPETCFINVTDNDSLEKEKQECLAASIPYCQMNSDMYSCLASGGYKNPAWDQITFELYSHTYYQRTVTLTAFPSYYLEPNTRIKINDSVTNTYGDFMIQNITLPLDVTQSMSITANECMVKR